jgi:hypothetical protein
MNLIRTTILVAATFLAAGSLQAQTLSNGASLVGFRCMSLTLTTEEGWKPSSLPPVFAAPTEGSKQLGTGAGIIYVAWPLNKVNGFVDILRPNGERGWISEKMLKPFAYGGGTKSCKLYWKRKDLIGWEPVDASSQK